MRALLRLAVLLAAALGGGFVWFALDAARPPPSAPGGAPVLDGIVALTGGQDRVETAFDLLAAGRGRLLLISGVAPHVTLDQLLREWGKPLPPDFDSRVTLGRQATTTIGNAAETASWARANGLHSLLVVTAGYHMRRALTELRLGAPELAFTPYPVQPPAMRAPFSEPTLRLLAREYAKLLGAEGRAWGGTVARALSGGAVFR